MGGFRIESAVGTGAVDASVLDRAGPSRIDYVDHFALGPFDATIAAPEQWARAMFGDVPSPAERFIWQGLLQLRLRKGRSPSTVAGWTITERGEDWIRLEAASAAMRGGLVVRSTAEALSLATTVRYDRARAALVWRPLSAVHRRLAPGLLRDTLDTVSAAPDLRRR
ncbi:hypothetical protein J0910_02095 [Nocardiopsis sp. CNT-189]|uniref:hypothetical protein n=1 Tax=Nocardiopsis oceanisediminis TaxID=2816862 RepID=UPI003B29A2C8